MKRRLIVRSLLVAGLLLPGMPAWAQMGDYPFCQIVDRIDEPIWEAELGWVLTEDLSGPDGDEAGILEFNLGSGIAYLPTSAGTFDVRVELESWFFTDDGGVDLPDQVGMLLLDTLWTHRLPEGLSFRLGIQPGFYTDFEDLSGQDVFLPFSLSAIRAFSEQFSGLVGLRVYPGFDRIIDPDIGLRWVLWETWKFDLFYPESRIAYSPTDLWRVYVGLRTRPWPEFQLERDDSRDRFLYDEDRFFIGYSYAMFGWGQLRLEVGQAFNREIDFDQDARSADVDDAFFASVGLTGSL